MADKRLQVLFVARSAEQAEHLQREADRDIDIEAVFSLEDALERLREQGWDVILTGDCDAVSTAALLKAARDRSAAPEATGEFPVSATLDDTLVGESSGMSQVRHLISLVKDYNSTVFISGETGTGKELVARAIHFGSRRAKGPFLCINCAAIPNDLLEDELFGHVKGAFTGALQSRKGYFEQAHGGTLFLDEIGNMGHGIQQKLLRALQDRQVTPLGSSRSIPVDVRIVTATNADLLKLVEEKKFRDDLYYRLNVFPIRIPSLRERHEDVPLLVSHFLKVISSQEGIPGKSISEECIKRLVDHPWPGNIRQLRNAVEYAMIMSGRSQVIDSRHFRILGFTQEEPLDAPRPVADSSFAPEEPPASAPMSEVGEDGVDFCAVVQQVERNLLLSGLKKTGGNKQRAAQLLKMKRTTLVEKMKRLNLETGEE